MAGASTTAAQSLLAEFREAVADDMLTLALLHSEELSADRIGQLHEAGFPETLCVQLHGDKGREAIAMMRQGMADLGLPVSTSMLDELAADFAGIYLTHGIQASPAESVWIDEDGLAMQEPMFQVREIYRRHGFTVANWRMRSDDHLVCQLQFLSHLVSPKGGAGGLATAATFLDEHSLRWIDEFAARVIARCDTPFYAGLSALTAAYLDEVRDHLAAVLNESRPTREEIDRRMKPKRQSLPELSCGDGGMAPSW